MASSFTVTLDTTAPAGPAISIAGGAAITSVQDVSAGISTSDGGTAGYQMKIWGDVDPAFDPAVQATEATSSWMSFAATESVRLSAGDGVKTLNVRIRDDVLNESSVASDSITLDSSVPVVNIVSGPDRTRVSDKAGADTTTVTWTSDSDFDLYEVAVVPTAGSVRGSGTVIGAAAGSTGTSGNAAAAGATMTTTIHGADLKTASAADGDKVVKIFVREAATGVWSA